MSVKLPALGSVITRTSGVNAFSGLNHNLRIMDSEFYDMKNMSSALLPVMSSREKRRKLRSLSSPNGLFAHEKLCWVDGGSFYYDGVVKGAVTDSEKRFVRMGAYVLIWPDKKYYNTHTGEFGSLEAQYTSSSAVSCVLCRIDGQPYSDYTVSATAPESPQSGAYWLDISVSPNVLKQYANSMWQSIPTVYTRISATGIGTQFSKHDGVSISGMSNSGLNGNFYLVDADENSIIVVALITAPVQQMEAVTVQRKVPDMDFVCEHGNRLWGCSSAKHEIYASALGDPKNWNQFMGLSSDSYAVTVGTTGAFTGACSHLGYVLFWKEDCVHQILGTKPSNFQLDTTTCRGVAAGSEKSLGRVNETLYYMSTQDVCAFNSALPSGISNALGTERFTEGIGGVLGSRYYLSVKDKGGDRHLYVYDTKLGVWVREDDVNTLAFAALGNDLYMLDADGGLWSMTGSGTYDGSGAQDEEDVSWMLETGDIGLDTPANQYVSAIQLHAECEANHRINVAIQHNGNGQWEQVYSTTPSTRRSMVIPIIPQRARLIRLRITGEGRFRLYSLTMRIETGSDVYAAW